MSQVSKCDFDSNLSAPVSLGPDSNNHKTSVAYPEQLSPVRDSSPTEREKMLMEAEIKLQLQQEVRRKKFMEIMARPKQLNVELPKETLQKSGSPRDAFPSLSKEPIDFTAMRFATTKFPAPESLIRPEYKENLKSKLGDTSSSKK